MGTICSIPGDVHPHSANGMSGVRRAFHRLLHCRRSNVGQPGVERPLRPVSREEKGRLELQVKRFSAQLAASSADRNAMEVTTEGSQLPSNSSSSTGGVVGAGAGSELCRAGAV